MGTKYVFDRNDFNWGEEFYEDIAKKMDLPSFFGKNADALWDMLTGYVKTPCEIVLKNFSREENEYNHYVIDLIIKCFEDAEKLYPNEYKITKIN